MPPIQKRGTAGPDDEPITILGREYASNTTVIYLTNRGLTSMPDMLCQLTALTTLRLSDNQLTSLSSEVGCLTALTELNLSYNQLTSLPSEMGCLTALTRLGLSYNELTSLPAEVGNITALTELYLSNNQLTSLPLCVAALRCLHDQVARNRLELDRRKLFAAFPTPCDPGLYTSAGLVPDIQRKICALVAARPW